MSQTVDDPEGRLVSMIMEANKYARFAAVCDKDGNILWNSHRNNVDNILTLDETKQSLRRAAETWKVRDTLAEKIGRGQYAIVGYEKIKRITVPLQNGHMLFVSIEGEKPEYIKDIMKIVDYVERNH
ncbi:hypothetical protein C6988_04340 [Nitrosopumilus sp. b1]|uniref:hypothetical protein n=1 Tax=Nitrosopumilus sp. b1 TaxID=2109907 RepID=UPI0015F57CFB|nr:hypothetical protein [Nitrosopumilus sp. b1]KAF6243307.1 hypothetical protein C6988_04340 [Nitrosopumilus sp. b1]